jgi:hypothetical protein
MGLIELILTLALVGILLWLVETYIPMDAGIKKLLQVVVIIIVVLWLLQSFGVIGHVGGNSIDRVRIN